MKFIFITEGMRMFKRNLSIKKQGFKKYDGNAAKICKQIVEDCYNKKENYFMTSTGHFKEFWTRDFGLCAESLINTGYKQEAKKTIKYALDKFEKNHVVTTTINPKGKPFDFPKFSPDSLAFMLHTIAILNDKKIISKYKEFLQTQVDKYYYEVFDEKTGLVKNKHFGSMKDHAIRKSSCYDNIMCAWTIKNSNKLKLKTSLKENNLKKIIKEKFWNGTHFIDDLSGKKIISGDANVYPYWTNTFTNKKMIKSSVETIKKQKLDNPIPIKYSIEKPKTTWYGLLAKDYEFQNIWPMSGIPFIEVVSRVNKPLAKKYLKQYEQLIEKNYNFLEVFSPDMKPFKTFFYTSDEGMIWASMYLRMSSKLYSNL